MTRRREECQTETLLASPTHNGMAQASGVVRAKHALNGAEASSSDDVACDASQAGSAR